VNLKFEEIAEIMKIIDSSSCDELIVETGDVKLVDTPFAAPRRLRFDSRGNLWIPGFSSSLLARFHPRTG